MCSSAVASVAHSLETRTSRRSTWLQLRVFIGAKRECGVLKRVLGAAVRAAAARLGTSRIHAALAARISAAALRRVAHESAAWFAAVHFVRMVYVC